MKINTRKRTKGRNYAQKQIQKLIGTSIMVVNGSPNFSNAPFEIHNGKKLNRLCFIPFLFQSKPNAGRIENNKRYNEALANHLKDVEKVQQKKYADFDTYTLPKVLNTSAIIKINA